MSKKPHVEGSSLPFPTKPSGSIAGRTMQESVYSPQAGGKYLPDDAPNILIMLIDDAGPAMPDTFGGEIHTPTLGRLLNDGSGITAFTPPPCAHPHGLHC